MAQIDDLHRVRMAALPAGRVIMVAAVRRRGGARCDLGHLRSTWYLFHGPPSPDPFAAVRLQYHLATGNLAAGGIRENMIRV
jgi:hypothetical protein